MTNKARQNTSRSLKVIDIKPRDYRNQEEITIDENYDYIDGVPKSLDDVIIGIQNNFEKKYLPEEGDQVYAAAKSVAKTLTNTIASEVAVTFGIYYIIGKLKNADK